jgi:hypothetical protein
VSAIADNPNWSGTLALINLLNATYLLPDSTTPGTLLLPTNRAFRFLRELLECAPPHCQNVLVAAFEAHKAICRNARTDLLEALQPVS